MPWLLLLVAGLFEVGWAVGLKASNGFTRPVVSMATVFALLLSLALLLIAMKSLPVGTAYAVWTGIGAFGTVLIGILAFGEPVNPTRILCLGLILSGVIGLKLS